MKTLCAKNDEKNIHLVTRVPARRLCYTARCSGGKDHPRCTEAFPEQRQEFSSLARSSFHGRQHSRDPDGRSSREDPQEVRWCLGYRPRSLAPRREMESDRRGNEHADARCPRQTSCHPRGRTQGIINRTRGKIGAHNNALHFTARTAPKVRAIVGDAKRDMKAQVTLIVLVASLLSAHADVMKLAEAVRVSVGQFKSTRGGYTFVPIVTIDSTKEINQMSALVRSLSLDTDRGVAASGFWAVVVMQDGSGKTLLEGHFSPADGSISIIDSRGNAIGVGESAELSTLVFELLQSHSPESVAEWPDLKDVLNR